MFQNTFFAKITLFESYVFKQLHRIIVDIIMTQFMHAMGVKKSGAPRLMCAPTLQHVVKYLAGDKTLKLWLAADSAYLDK